MCYHAYVAPLIRTWRIEMNLIEAIKTEKPFSHPDMIGYYKLFRKEGFPDYISHEDLLMNYFHDFNKTKPLTYEEYRDSNYIHYYNKEAVSYYFFSNLTLYELLREDWFVHED
jgi:hypothetical protein